MTKYVKLIGKQIISLPESEEINYLDEGKLNTDGFKEFVPATYEPGKPYEWSYEETATQIIEHVTEIIPDPVDLLKAAKEAKIAENDTVRDAKLIEGVTYDGVLFDSDTDQKVNLLAIVSTMDDSETITWFGMDNQPLVCTKADLINIGGLITALHSFVWQRNAEIKAEINEATTVEEVEAIIINYGLEE